MIVLIQDSQGISITTVQSIKSVVRRLLTLLGSEKQDYNFALATYATFRRMSCFGSAADTISYMDTKYHPGESGRNRLNLALSQMVLKQFDKRRDDRKGDDTVKVSFNFSYFPIFPVCVIKSDLSCKNRNNVNLLSRKCFKYKGL